MKPKRKPKKIDADETSQAHLARKATVHKEILTNLPEPRSPASTNVVAITFAFVAVVGLLALAIVAAKPTINIADHGSKVESTPTTTLELKTEVKARSPR